MQRLYQSVFGAPTSTCIAESGQSREYWCAAGIDSCGDVKSTMSTITCSGLVRLSTYLNFPSDQQMRILQIPSAAETRRKRPFEQSNG